MGAESILLVLLLLIVGLWAVAFFIGRWQLNRNGRHYELDVAGTPSQVMAVAAKGLKGRNPLAVVDVSGTTATREIEKRYLFGPMEGRGCVAVARIKCSPAGRDRTKVVASNSFDADTMFWVPAKPNAVGVSRRAIERAVKAIDREFSTTPVAATASVAHGSGSSDGPSAPSSRIER